MEFRVLGPLEVAEGGRILQLGSGRQLALVGLLLLHANEVVSVDRIVDELWGESPPPTAAKIVRNSVSVLRRELGDRLVTYPPGYVLRVDPGELDSERLERAVERGDLESLDEALALWRGQPLSQLAYESFAATEIARLEDLRLAAVEARVETQLALGRHAPLIGELETLVEQEPLRERLRAQLMLALYRAGRQADALEVYRLGRRALDERLGIEPGPELRDLERKILTQDESLAAPPAPAPAAFLRRRRALALLSAAFVLGGAVALAAYLATRGSVVGLKAIPPNYVGVVDPKSNAIVAAVPVGLRPGPVAPGGNAVWVGNLDDRNLTKIDPAKRSPVGTFSLGNRTPSGVAVGPDAVWVVHGIAGDLSRVEPEFGRVARTVHVTTRAFGAPTGGAAVGAGAVWAVFGDSTLARVSGGKIRKGLAGTSPTAVVVGGGAVWVANGGDATVERFSPETFDEGPVQRISVGKQPAGLAYGAGSLWVADKGDDAVTRIDPATRSTSTIPVGHEPVAVAVGEDSVWVANAGDRTISRIDPARGKVVRTIRVGSSPAGVAVWRGFIWVSAQSP